MSNHAQFRRAAVERGVPEDEVGRFATYLRFVIETSGERSGNPVGRCGGEPRLPAGTQRPGLPFVASFDCAALPRVDDLPLPTDGSLFFFLDHEEAIEADSREEEQGYARVVYVPAGTDPAAADPADGGGKELFATVLADLPDWLRAKDEEELTAYQRSRARTLPHRAELCALVDSLWPPARHGWSILFGGYTWGIGAQVARNVDHTPEIDMAEANLRALGLDLTGEEKQFRMEEELDRVLREWVPLVQFRADNVHHGRFLIPRDDLAAGRLDKARSFTEFLE